MFYQPQEMMAEIDSKSDMLQCTSTGGQEHFQEGPNKALLQLKGLLVVIF